MRAPLALALGVVLGSGSLACGLLTNVDWDRVVAHSDGGASSSGASGGTSGSSGTSGGTSGSSGATGACHGDQVECLATDGSGTVGCCAPGGDPGPPTSIAAGGSNACAVSKAGQIKCWGANGNGELGRGANGLLAASTPLVVFRIPTGATQVSVGGSHVCAIVNGFLSCWGANTSGQLGNGDTNGTALPTTITLPAPPDSVGAGTATTCASAGRLGYCWGDNTALQAAADNGSNRVVAPLPVMTLSMLDVADIPIAAGHQHACASAGGHLYCWGTNTSNALGSAGPTQSAKPLAVVNGVGPGSVAIGESHACALAGGAVQCWGSNIFGELGLDSAGEQSVGAVSPTGLDVGVGSLCAGTYHTCVVQQGVVKCFGSNNAGQLGIAQAAARVPTAVQGLTGFTATQVACGSMHTCALSNAGTIKCWGAGSNGERGDGTTTMMNATPQDVMW